MAQSNEPSIIEMNRTICEFMGWEFKKDPKFEHMAYFEGRQMWCDNLQGVNKVLLEGFKYHEDWNKLMPVVEKIEKEFCNDFELIIYSSSCYINKWNHEKERYDTFISGAGKKLDAVYAAVYQFITWLNQQKQNNGQ